MPFKPNTSPSGLTRRTFVDEFDSSSFKGGDQFHQRINIPANNAIAGFHPLDRRNRKTGESGSLSLVNIQQRSRGSKLICCDHRTFSTSRAQGTYLCCTIAISSMIFNIQDIKNVLIAKRASDLGFCVEFLSTQEGEHDCTAPNNSFHPRRAVVCTENLIRVAGVTESRKLAE